MKYTIHRNNKIVTSVNATGDITEKLFGEETLTMNFTLTKFVEFKIGDSVQVYGKTYYIATEPNVEKISTREYRYNLTFNGIKYRLAEVQYFFYDEKNQLTMPEFSIMGNAQKMVELLVANANRVQSGWSVGKVEDTEHKLVDFSNYNCLGALTRISDEFGLEFWVDADKSIHLTERKRASGYTFAYGQSKGLKSISRTPYTEASLVTRLYAKGAERNIPKNYRNGQKALRMPVPYLEANTDKYGIVEHTQTFDEIYPKRVGVVTEVYPDNPLQFTDSTLDFDLNAYNEYGTTILIAGVSAKVIFQTGDLAGYTLEVKQYGFNSATKTFTLLKNKDEKSFEIPSEAFRPKVGDKYILVDIMMPEKYVENAEAELQAKAQEYLDKNSRQRFVYSVVPDPLYFKEIRANIVLGQTIRFSDPDFNLNDDIRIISLTRDIRNPYKISFEIAEQATITQIVRNYIEKEKKETELRKEQKHNAEMARRSYLFAEEIKDNVFDNEGYFDTDKIKPLSIETQHISVGSRMQQFTLPNVILTLSEDNLRLKNTAGEMVHLTINPNAPRVWNIAQNETPNFSQNFNYIYLKADKVGSNAVFVVSEQKIMLDNDPIFYYFLVGSVSSVIDGVRRIKTNYGFTQISPNEITTGRLSSANGQNWIDLLQDRIEINAKVSFAPNSPALTQVQGMVDNISVGGRNLLRNANFKNNAEYWYKGSPPAEFSVTERSAKIIHSLNSYNEINQIVPCEPNTEYCVSAMVKGNGIARIFMLERKGDGYTNIYKDHFHSFNLTNEYQRVSFTFRTQPDAEKFYAIFRNMGSSVVYYKDLKVEKGNKPTDWTPAPEDLEAEITNAQNTANTALGKFNELGVLAWKNAVEKAQLGETIIQGGYIKTELLNASAIVSNGGGTTNTQLQQAINSLAFGGRNLLLNSKNDREVHRWETYPENYIYYDITGRILEPNTEYTLTWEYMTIGNIKPMMAYFVSNVGEHRYIDGINHSNTWAKKQWTFRTGSNPNQSGIIRFDHKGSIDGQNCILKTRFVKLEKGNKPTDWTPAPEDLEAQFQALQSGINGVQNNVNTLQNGISNIQTSLGDIKTKTDNFTSIQGGLVSSNIISVGSTQVNQNAFISGVTDAGGLSVRFGAGANYANKNNAPFRVLDNGKMIAENADISGRINAESGKIGGWDISTNSLSSKTAKLIFGEVNQFGMLEDGLMISENNFDRGNNIYNSFNINSHKTKQGATNLAALISASGIGLNNALELSATGSVLGQAGNNALVINAGSIFLNNTSNSEINFKLYRTDNGHITKGFTGDINIGSRKLRFEKGLLVE